MSESIASYAELPLRRAAVAAAVERSTPGEAAAMLEAVVRHAAEGRAAALTAAMGWATYLLREKRVSPGKVAVLARAAEAEGLEAAALVLGDAPPFRALASRARLPEVCVPVARAVTVNPGHRARVGGQPRVLSFGDAGAERWVEMGAREALFRARRTGLLERLLAHPDPLVVRGLLRCPELSLADALALVSRRPSTPERLHEAAEHDGWVRRLEFRVSLCHNPFTPTGVVLSLVPTLTGQERRRLARSETVHPLVRRAASALSRAEGPGARAEGAGLGG